MQKINSLILKTFLSSISALLISSCAQKNKNLEDFSSALRNFKTTANFGPQTKVILSAPQLKAATGDNIVSEEQLVNGLETQWGKLGQDEISDSFVKDTVIELAQNHFNPTGNGHWPRYSSFLSVMRNASPSLEAVSAKYLKKAPQNAYILSIKGPLELELDQLASLADNTILLVDRKELYQNAQKLKLGIELSKQDKIVCDALKGISTETTNTPELFAHLETKITVPPRPYLDILLVHGYVSGFDPHSYLLSEESSKKMMSNSSKMVGIGASIQMNEEKNFVLVEIFEGSPAEAAGLQAGDEILSVNQNNTKDISDLSSLIKLVRGEPGTTVQLKVSREGQEKLFEITRKEFQVSDVSLVSQTLVPDAEFIKYSRFSPDSVALLKEKLQNSKSAQKKVWVLDLRGNPGGLVDEAVELVELLGQNIQSLKQRLVFYFSDGQNFMGPEYVNQKQIPVAPNLILLTNEGSASASEVTSGNIKALGNALILGSRTYGKGSMQRIFPVNSKLRAGITQGIYFTGDHRTPQFSGVEPHFKTSSLREKLQGIKSDSISLEADMPGAIVSPAGIASVESMPSPYSQTLKCLSDLDQSTLLVAKEDLKSSGGLRLGLEGLVATKAIECMKTTGELKN